MARPVSRWGVMNQSVQFCDRCVEMEPWSAFTMSHGSSGGCTQTAVHERGFPPSANGISVVPVSHSRSQALVRFENLQTNYESLRIKGADRDFCISNKLSLRCLVANKYCLPLSYLINEGRRRCRDRPPSPVPLWERPWPRVVFILFPHLHR